MKEISLEDLTQLLWNKIGCLNYLDILGDLRCCCKKGEKLYSKEGELNKTWTEFAGRNVYISDSFETYHEYFINSYSGRKFYID